MAKNTLCPIKDIKGWRSYNRCPYTKSLFARPGISDVLYTSGQKEKFFGALQKNVGREGYLTKEAMKKTLGELKHELDPKSFYKLCAAVLPEEKQRFALEKNAPSVLAGADAGKQPVSGERIQNRGLSNPRPEVLGKEVRIISPARTIRSKIRDDIKKDDSGESSFFHAMRTTIRKNN